MLLTQPTAVIAHLVEVEHQIKLTDIAEVVIKDLYKQMDGLQCR